MKHLLWVGGLLLLAMTSQANGQGKVDTSGTQLLNWCSVTVEYGRSPDKFEPPSALIDDGQCMAYLAGYTDALTHVAHFKYLCVPSTASRLEVAEAVVRYLKEHDFMLHHEASTLVDAALQIAYRCK